MHILFTAYEFVTETKPCGGFGHYLANISTIIAQHGHQVTILLMTNRNRTFYWKSNIEIVAFRYQHIGASIHVEDFLEPILNTEFNGDINRSLAFKYKIKEIHKRKPIDIIQYNGDRFQGWHRVWNIPVVIRLSSIPTWCDYVEKENSSINDYYWLKDIKTKLYLCPLSIADAVYSPSECSKKYANMIIKRKIRVIESPYYGQVVGELEDIYHIWGKKYLLYLGRVCVLKGMKVVIGAIHEILEQDKDMYLVVAGYIAREDLISGLFIAAGEYRNRILVLGEIKSKDYVQKCIENAFACIFPSRADNLPNSCIESMGQGKIVIGTYGASFEQLIKNKINGLLIKRDSPEALIGAVKYINQMSKEERVKMSEAAKERINKLNPENIYDQVINFYSEVIDKKNKIPWI